MSRRFDLATPAALGLGLFVLLLFTQDAVGIPRDESIYFDAGERYARWLDDLWERPTAAFSDEVLRQRFEYNREHPALPKLLFGVSHRLFHDALGWTDHALGFRLPALFFSALLLALAYLVARRFAGPAPALFAALGTVLLPRHFFHLHIAAFDVAATAAWLLVVLCYLRALEPDARTRDHVFAGVAFGLAIAIKHNAYFLPPLLVLHWVVIRGADAWRAGGWRKRARAVPLMFPAMALLGPLLLYLSWPFLWHHPIERFGWYLGFHAHHEHYSWHYLGEVLRAPPFPLHYPFVVTALTVPFSLLLPLVVGLLWAVARFAGQLGPVRRGLERAGRRLPETDPTERDRLGLVLLLGLFPMALIAMPGVPIFGGVKHWMHAMPFLLLLGGMVVERLAKVWADDRERPGWATPMALGLSLLLLLPAATAARHFHPYGTSAYNEVAGGLPGAAGLGMQRQYWSNAVTGVLPWLNEHAPRGARIYFHELTHGSYKWYRADGQLRRDLRWASSVEQSDLAAWQFHQEFRDREHQIWTHYGTRRPVFGLYLDEAPLVVVYARRGLLSP